MSGAAGLGEDASENNCITYMSSPAKAGDPVTT